jgi:hypothetical protein
MTTTTEKYIKKAVQEAKKELSGTNITNCNFEMSVDNVDAIESLASAIEAQAKANSKTATAITTLASRIVATDACVIKVIHDKVDTGLVV